MKFQLTERRQLIGGMNLTSTDGDYQPITPDRFAYLIGTNARRLDLII